MRKLVLAIGFAAVAAGAACRGSGADEAVPATSLVSMTGCVTQSNGTLILERTSAPRRGTVGTTGRVETDQPARYRLVDDANLSVDRYVGRTVEISGKLESRAQVNTPDTTAEQADALSRLPTIHVTHLASGGGDCTR